MTRGGNRNVSSGLLWLRDAESGVGGKETEVTAMTRVTPAAPRCIYIYSVCDSGTQTISRWLVSVPCPRRPMNIFCGPTLDNNVITAGAV